jgi:putative two-component system response regulator
VSSVQIDRLESLLRSALSGSEPEIRNALEKLQTELHLRLSQSSPESVDFFSRTLRVLKRIRGGGTSALRLTILRNCIVFFLHHANFEMAYESAHQQYLLARQIDSSDACRRALNSMGTALAELGNVPDALTHYSAALAISHTDNLEIEGVVLNNMGTALNYASLYREAIPCFERVLSIAQPTWALPVFKKALTNLAQSLYYLERFDEAFDAIERVLHESSAPRSPSEHFDQALREFTFVQIALELGEGRIASEHASRCANHATAAKSVSRKLMAEIAMARCEVRSGNAAVGLTRLEDLVAQSTKIDSMYKDALIAAVQANDEAGRPENALVHMERLLDHVRERRISTLKRLMEMQGHAAVTSRAATRIDLLTLECKEANLRVRVAERDKDRLQREMLERLAVTADLKDEPSGEHGYRVGRLAGMMAVRLGWPEDAASAIEVAARLHDIGKIAIPDKILGSSDVLREAERQFMCMHAPIGAQLLAKSGSQELRLAEEIARHHHEWWDGTGYPDGLAGGRIPVHARIVALADVFDALTHGRPYSTAWSVNRALEDIEQKRGHQFDPRLTDEFLALIRDLTQRSGDLELLLSSAANESGFLQTRRQIRDLLKKEHLS